MLHREAHAGHDQHSRPPRRAASRPSREQAGLTAGGRHGPGWKLVPRRKPIHIVDGLPQGGYAEVYELVCCYCGDDPDLDYRHISPDLGRIRGPYPILAGIAAYGKHAEYHRRQATQPRESPAAPEEPVRLRGKGTAPEGDPAIVTSKRHAYRRPSHRTENATSRAGTMTAAPPEGWDGEGVRSLEVRWIFPGRLGAAMAGWFGRFPVRTTALQDAYLVDPHLPGLSVKVRAGRALEVKAYRGSAGLLHVAGRARGRLQSWQKWSFPAAAPSPASSASDGWKTVNKTRRISRFSLDGGPARAAGPGPGQGPGCAVELTEVRARDEAWWTLGFEATGPADVLRSQLEAAAALVFASALPGGVELGLDDSMSYAQWLRAQPGTAVAPEPGQNLHSRSWPSGLIASGSGAVGGASGQEADDEDNYDGQGRHEGHLGGFDKVMRAVLLEDQFHR